MAKQAQQHALRKWRISKGLTLEKAAERVGTVRQVWSDWERGRRRPSSVTMSEIYQLTEGVVQPNDFYDLTQGGTAGQKAA